MQRNRKLILFAFVIVALMLITACGNEGQSLEGKNIVTFELSGGTLELKTSSVGTKINFAYEPGTYILDPAEIPGYKMYRPGYVFTGWYTTSECNPSEKWDFSTPFESESLTLYAGWKEAISYTYQLYYVVDGSPISLGAYEVSEGDVFEDWRKYAGLRPNHTAIGYYSDKDFTTPWDSSFKHPGGDSDTEIPVYVNYIDGEWKLVDDYSELRSALMANENVYLTADIDCLGETFCYVTYSGVFEGNGFTVSNLTVEKSGALRPACSIFKELGEGAEIRNVSFTGVVYNYTSLSASASAFKVSALAINARGAKITNVSVVGTITTDYTGELPKLNSAVYEDDATAQIENFTANVIYNE
ncbi:MAG: InlB B-repeat-containing protein [Clostridia bacterium]|nr:InlB B-repeat-containing protein [Clostridia bacterium]